VLNSNQRYRIVPVSACPARFSCRVLPVAAGLFRDMRAHTEHTWPSHVQDHSSDMALVPPHFGPDGARNWRLTGLRRLDRVWYAAYFDWPVTPRRPAPRIDNSSGVVTNDDTAADGDQLDVDPACIVKCCGRPAPLYLDVLEATAPTC
jgi:hypothetical protein